MIIDGGKRCDRASSIRSTRLTVGANEQCVVNRQRRGPQRRCRRQPPQCRAIRGMESRIHLQIGELGSATIFNARWAFVPLLIVLQKLDDHFQIP